MAAKQGEPVPEERPEREAQGERGAPPCNAVPAAALSARHEEQAAGHEDKGEGEEHQRQVGRGDACHGGEGGTRGEGVARDEAQLARGAGGTGHAQLARLLHVQRVAPQRKSARALPTCLQRVGPPRRVRLRREAQRQKLVVAQRRHVQALLRHDVPLWVEQAEAQRPTVALDGVARSLHLNLAQPIVAGVKFLLQRHPVPQGRERLVQPQLADVIADNRARPARPRCPGEPQQRAEQHPQPGGASPRRVIQDDQRGGQSCSSVSTSASHENVSRSAATPGASRSRQPSRW